MVNSSSTVGGPPIAIIGAGRAGSTLARALHTAGYPVTSIWNRTSAHAVELAASVGAEVVHELGRVPEHATLVLLAVSDDSLETVAGEIVRAGAPLDRRMVIHCSGATPVSVLAPLARQGALIGGFHPLMAVGNRHSALVPGLAFAIEAEQPLRGLLWTLASDLGGRPFDLDPADRTLYHAAAVLASNYSVVLAALAGQLLARAGVAQSIGSSALLPLLRSTLSNLEAVGLPDALTGPLVRGDAGTVAEHLRALDEAAPGIAEVYRTLGNAALPLVEARGELDGKTLYRLEDALGARAELTSDKEELCESLFAISSA